MGSFRISVREPEKLRKIAAEELSLKILPKVGLKVRDAVREPIKELLIEHLIETDVYKGIIGGIPTQDKEDIQAVMGLDDEKVEEFTSGFPEMLREMLKVNRSQKFVAGIDVFLPRNYQEVLSEKFQYISPPSAKVIPWMEWILTGLGGVDASILFGDDFESSRSGRAIMVSGGEKFDVAADFNYTDGKGSDFIRQVFENKSFVTRINEILKKEYTKQIKALR